MNTAQQRFGRRLALPSTLQIKREIMGMHAASERTRLMALAEIDSSVAPTSEQEAITVMHRKNAQTASDGVPSPARAMRSMERAFLRNNPDLVGDTE